MKPDDALDHQLARLARTDLDDFRSQRLRARAHHELRRVASDRERGLLEPLLLASCAAVVLVRLLWFVVTVMSRAV